MKIEGVREKKLVVNGHNRGNLTELLRDDEGLLEKFGQASLSVTYPRIIKAFHWHEKQDDLWFMLNGNAQVVLYDLRKNSKTHKTTQVVYMGELYEPILLLIPKGVAHGYRVLGEKPATLLYFTTQSYDPKNPDEKRIQFDDPEIGFDWTTKNR
ncbi:dTDP-4-dehydrorhamnose 3,5-epimerase family protein [Candidatus Woesearchaeota archaeon]|nr:dTDP-4-dehydrorhamnose 3,5-epimerase family protein [Candidatus Woesearchaeota archaeon]